MKTILTICLLIASITLNTASAQTVYTVSSNGNYSGSCSNCTFNIAAGVIATINVTGTCSNCTFNGGIVDVKNNINCQPCSFNNDVINMTSAVIKPNSGTTTFQNVTLTVSGSGGINANTPVTLTNSNFTFSGNAYYNNNGGQLDMTNSTRTFLNSADFNANAGPIDLKSGSKLIAGNGLSSSNATITINGPALNIYDNASSIILEGSNNVYYNWGSFSSLSNSKTYTTTYPSAASTMNCGGAGQNACGGWGSPSVFGPALFNYTGVGTLSSLLPVVLADFAVANTSNNVLLSWSTEQELNASYFGIERSTNSSAWDIIGTVSAKGNSNGTINYTYTDASPLSGAAYYRLVMVDLDGKKTYSDIRTVRTNVIKGINFYPNPVVDAVNISLGSTSTEVDIKLVNQSGQVVLERKAAANTALVTLNVQQYPPGIYIVSVATTTGVQQTGKIMIAK